MPRQPARPVSIRLFVDGGSRGNPGPAAAGVVLADPDGTVLVERGYFIGRATNNVAEYIALIRGLELASEFSPQRLEVFADSELVVRQITGQYRVKSPDLLPLFEQAQMILLRFDSWQIRHIPRAKNERADRLANLAMNHKADVEDANLDSLPSSAQAGEQSSRPAIEVSVIVGCDPRQCPATMMAGERFRFDSATPAGFCIFAATEVVPRVAAMLAELEVVDSAPQDTATVECPRCGARFEIHPADI